ncbi:ABC transporter ATP-binding protein [Rathayibacter toxicus]|uniref:ABC transporter ATP-binding protein n=1 Tax=Rathayibacter toxicus TaxID=145458 RepID=A0A0C5BGK9_9MICO|nr:ABC transporter ATP-binding protein [Rathayibacter toxicus]AJM78279.1 peptide ABC transporter ATP-binding protein [Rathayibacter toxicus]ALS57198.1 peptide ABC transporter ATP-binding protein [Rathayibacter toxicus]KKM46399.1 peptide ABC transporter ATP-binding protein [Rathayibacter toxicus]PPG22928.1 ABC transporter ATP-binding protein [Rathayibacter toxicus]PPG47509.1 ABC transporter ATP-binding protein [Rathayibacter toxicus]
MSDNHAPIIRLQHVSKRFGDSAQQVTALDDITVDIGRGQFTAVMGPSGSGKSTLMHLVAGLDVASTGTIHVDGIDITHMGDAQLTEFRRSRLGFVFQSFNLVPTLDIRENIYLPFLLGRRQPRREEARWIEDLVDMLGLSNRLSHRPHQLSGGQQQRVAIARALAARPAVIVADEPTGALDSRTGRDVLSILRGAVAEWGQTVVMVTHDPTAAAHADRILFLADGKVVGDCPAMSAADISTTMLGMEAAA